MRWYHLTCTTPPEQTNQVEGLHDADVMPYKTLVQQWLGIEEQPHKLVIHSKANTL